MKTESVVISLELNAEMWNLLSRGPIFEGLSPEAIGQISPCVTYSVRQYGPGENIYHKGDRVEHLGVVLDGSLVVCDQDAQGCRTTVADIGRNSMFGEAMLFSSAGTVPHDIYTDKGATVLYLVSDFFMRPCGKDCPNKAAHATVMTNLLRILSDRAVQLNRKISYLTAPDLKAKIAMYLYDLYRAMGTTTLRTPFNRDQLAEFLAVARPSLSREFVNLKKMGVIDFSRSNITIVDLDKLRELAGE